MSSLGFSLPGSWDPLISPSLARLVFSTPDEEPDLVLKLDNQTIDWTGMIDPIGDSGVEFDISNLRVGAYFPTFINVAPLHPFLDLQGLVHASDCLEQNGVHIPF